MTIIGVTGEPASLIRPFIDKHKIKYTVAIGRAPEYATRGIPHSWLVDARGKVVWKGHPARLSGPMVEEYLGAVDLPPRFKLARELSRANKLLNAGKLTSGVKALEKYLKRPKSDEVEAEAKAALEKVLAYGKSLLEKADRSADEGDLVTALNALAAVDTYFKSHDFAKEAKAKEKAWKKDDEKKVELAAARIILKAEALIDAGSYRAAGGQLARVVKSKKYSDTRMRETAQKLLEEVTRQLSKS